MAALFAEPPKTQFDLRFALGSIPVRVHPWFWLVSLLLAVQGPTDLLRVGTWIGASFFSILVHELGHALTFRAFGWRPRIVLYGMGGLASADPTSTSPEPRGTRMILISAAGPFAGFLLAMVVIAGLVLTGHQVHLLGWELAAGAPLEDRATAMVVNDLLWINALWGLVNLLPVHPLDGGQIAQELLSFKGAERGTLRSLWLSLFTAAFVAVAGGIVWRSMFVLLLFGYLSFVSYSALVHLGALVPLSRWSLARRAARFRRRQTQAEKRRHLARAADRLEKDQARREEQAAADPEVSQQAEALLKNLTEEIRRTRKEKGPNDEPGAGQPK